MDKALILTSSRTKDLYPCHVSRTPTSDKSLQCGNVLVQGLCSGWELYTKWCGTLTSLWIEECGNCPNDIEIYQLPKKERGRNEEFGLCTILTACMSLIYYLLFQVWCRKSVGVTDFVLELLISVTLYQWRAGMTSHLQNQWRKPKNFTQDELDYY